MEPSSIIEGSVSAQPGGVRHGYTGRGTVEADRVTNRRSLRSQTGSEARQNVHRLPLVPASLGGARRSRCHGFKIGND